MQRKYRIISAFLFVFSLMGFSFAVLEGIGYTDATFTGISITGAQLPETHYLITQLTGGTSGTFTVNITNPTLEDITIKLDFVDQTVTSDGEGNKACTMIHSGTDFGTNLLWDTGAFVVASGSSVYRTITYNYHYCFSGQSLGCLVQLLTGDAASGTFTVGLGKVNFIDFSVLKDDFNCGKYTIKALPSQRISNFAFSGFIGFWINNDFSVMYTGNITTSGNASFDNEGLATFMYPFPNIGSGFMMIIKSNSFLSVGYTGFYNDNAMDFTLLTGLSNSVYITGWFNRFYLDALPASQGTSGWRSLLVPGDTNNNDYVGASDLALINANLTVSLSPSDYRYDLNNDQYVTSTDQAIMIQNVTRNGFWRHLKSMLTGGYLTGNDIAPTLGQFPWN